MWLPDWTLDRIGIWPIAEFENACSAAGPVVHNLGECLVHKIMYMYRHHTKCKAAIPGQLFEFATIIALLGREHEEHDWFKP